MLVSSKAPSGLVFDQISGYCSLAKLTCIINHYSIQVQWVEPRACSRILATRAWGEVGAHLHSYDGKQCSVPHQYDPEGSALKAGRGVRCYTALKKRHFLKKDF